MNKKILYTLSITTLVLGLTLISCSPTEKKTVEQKKLFTQPIASIKQGNVFTIDNSIDQSIITKKGSTISIPANSLVTEKGKTPKGPVHISFASFHSVSEVIASGIPMQYDSAGVSRNFETAGMFKIEATDQKGNQLKIKEGKQVNIDLASHKQDSDFNFYQFNEQSGDWTFETTNNPKPNTKKHKLLAEAEAIKVPNKPTAPLAYKRGQFVFDLEASSSDLPELNTYKGFVWQYAGKDPKKDPKKNKGIFAIEWNSAEIKPIDQGQLLYNLVLSKGKKSIEIPVQPVLKGKALREAKREFAKRDKEYIAAINEKNAIEKAAKLQADFTRSMSLNGFGIYNYDRCWRNPDAIMVKVNFESDSETKISQNGVKLYLIENKDVVINYAPYQWDNFSYIPNKKNRLIAILPGNEVAVLSSDDFKTQTANILDKLNPERTFTLTKLDQKISSLDDLESIIQSI